MKAQILRGYGDADAFELADVAPPHAEPNQVRIRVQAIGINPMDVRIRSGSLRTQMPIEFPAILGYDVAGVVDQVGDGVTETVLGQRVVGLAEAGAYAELAVLNADILAPVPESLDVVHAVTVPTAAETAGRVIRLLDPQPGETVVLNGAAGSIGTLAVQMLHSNGVTVIGTASEENFNYLRHLGATPTTYGDGVVERIRAFAPKGVDAVFDITGHGFTDAALQLRGGPTRIVTIADFGAAQRGITVSYGEPAARSNWSDGIATTKADFASVVQRVADGDFVVEIARTFAFNDLPQAHEMSEHAHLRGKIVVLGPDEKPSNVTGASQQ